MQKLLRLKQVLEIVPIGQSAWWRGVKSGKFPAPFQLLKRCTVWKEEDILELVENPDKYFYNNKKKG